METQEADQEEKEPEAEKEAEEEAEEAAAEAKDKDGNEGPPEKKAKVSTTCSLWFCLVWHGCALAP